MCQREALHIETLHTPLKTAAATLSFQFPLEPLAPLWVARLCHAKYCNCSADGIHRCTAAAVTCCCCCCKLVQLQDWSSQLATSHCACTILAPYGNAKALFRAFVQFLQLLW
jgi:hypothetical protein